LIPIINAQTQQMLHRIYISSNASQTQKQNPVKQDSHPNLKFKLCYWNTIQHTCL